MSGGVSGSAKLRLKPQARRSPAASARGPKEGGSAAAELPQARSGRSDELKAEAGAAASAHRWSRAAVGLAVEAQRVT